MKAAPIAKTIRVGSLSIAVRKYADGRFGFDYTPPGEMRIKVRLQDLAAAEQRAREIVGAAHGGKVERLAIDERQYAEFLRWQSDHAAPARLCDVVSEMLADKAAKGGSKAAVLQLRSTLVPLAKDFRCNIGELTQRNVERWLRERAKSPARFNNMRTSFVSLCKFARRFGYLSPLVQWPEQIEKRRVVPEIGIFTPDELRALLQFVAAHSPEWLPLIVLGAFAGLRPEEINPEPASGKPGIRWENILWARDKIDVPAEVSKVRRRRFAALLPTAREWLIPLRGTGPVVPPRAHREIRLQWCRATGLKWKNDGLRHSFASYRLALTKDMAALCLEMGNSPSIVFKHYLDLRHEDEAERWFGVLPSSKSSKILAFQTQTGA